MVQHHTPESSAVMKDVPIKYMWEEFVLNMVQSKPIKLAVMKDVISMLRKEEIGRPRPRYATKKDVRTKSRMEEYVLNTVQRSRSRNIHVVMKDVRSMLRKEEYALGMVPRSSSAATRDVPTMPLKEEYVEDMVQRIVIVLSNK